MPLASTQASPTDGTAADEDGARRKAINSWASTGRSFQWRGRRVDEVAGHRTVFAGAGEVLRRSRPNRRRRESLAPPSPEELT